MALAVVAVGWSWADRRDVLYTISEPAGIDADQGVRGSDLGLGDGRVKAWERGAAGLGIRNKKVLPKQKLLENRLFVNVYFKMPSNHIMMHAFLRSASFGWHVRSRKKAILIRSVVYQLKINKDLKFIRIVL